MPDDGSEYSFESLVIIVSVAVMCCVVPPYLVHVSENMVTANGSAARLDCQFYGVPTPVINWAKNSYTLWSTARRRVRGGTVWINEVVADDAGLYQCWAESDAGIEYSVIRLAVEPLFTTFVPPVYEPGQ